MELYPAMIEQENQRYGPFLASTTVLMEAVRAGAGREHAHEAIKEHAVQVVRDLRSGRIHENDLPQRLANDERLHLNQDQVNAIMAGTQVAIGRASDQVEAFCQKVDSEMQQRPQARDFSASSIL
jgi:adenylosuccinate lyase